MNCWKQLFFRLACRSCFAGASAAPVHSGAGGYGASTHALKLGGITLAATTLRQQGQVDNVANHIAIHDLQTLQHEMGYEAVTTRALQFEGYTGTELDL